MKRKTTRPEIFKRPSKRPRKPPVYLSNSPKSQVPVADDHQDTGTTVTVWPPDEVPVGNILVVDLDVSGDVVFVTFSAAVNSHNVPDSMVQAYDDGDSTWKNATGATPEFTNVTVVNLYFPSVVGVYTSFRIVGLPTIVTPYGAGTIRWPQGPFPIPYPAAASNAVSGTVLDKDDIGADAIDLVFTGTGDSVGTNYLATTDLDGNYSQSVVAGWSGTITASSANVRLNPSSRTLSNVITPLTGRDFTKGTNWYLATTGNDTTGAGTFASPYKSFKKATTVAQPCDGIVFRGGTWSVSGEPANGTTWISVVPGPSGTSTTKNILVSNYASETAIVADAEASERTFINFTSGQHHWYFKASALGKLVFTGYSKVFNMDTAAAHDITFENIQCHNNGLWSGNRQATDAKSWRLRAAAYNISWINCEAYNVTGPCWNIAGGCHDLTFTDCVAHDADDGRGYPQFPDSDSSDADGFNIDHVSSINYNISFLRCTAYNCVEDCFDVKGHNVSYDRCTAYNAGACLWKHWSPTGVQKCTFYMRNCLGYNAKEVGIKLSNGVQFYAYNNTIVQDNTDTRDHCMGVNASSEAWTATVTTRNNVFVHLGSVAGTETMYYNNTGYTYDMDYDVFANSAGGTCVQDGVSAWTMAQVANNTWGGAVSGVGDHMKGAAPSFVDQDGHNFHLISGDSVAKDTGTDTSGLTGGSFVVDLDGGVRPQNIVDRGCYERS